MFKAKADHSADAANIQVMNQADEAKFKDYTDRVLADLNSHRHLAGGGVPNQMHSKAATKNGKVQDESHDSGACSFWLPPLPI